MMKWNLIQKHYVNELKLEVTPEEATQEAKALAMQQFAYYGMNQVADDMLANYAKSILENKEESRKVYEKLFERKVIDAVVPQITVTDTTVTPEEFAKLAEKAQYGSSPPPGRKPYKRRDRSRPNFGTGTRAAGNPPAAPQYSIS